MELLTFVCPVGGEYLAQQDRVLDQHTNKSRYLRNQHPS